MTDGITGGKTGGTATEPAKPGGPSDRPSPLATFPAGCLVSFGALTVLVAGLMILVLGVAFPGYRSSGTYRTAIELARADRQVIRALGQPIRETGVITVISELQPEGGGTRRFISVRISGPRGDGVLYAEGVERNGVVLGQAGVTLSSGRRIGLTSPH